MNSNFKHLNKLNRYLPCRGERWTGTTPRIHDDRKTTAVERFSNKGPHILVQATLRRTRDQQQGGVQSMLFLQVQIRRPIQRNHSSILRTHTNSLKLQFQTTALNFIAHYNSSFVQPHEMPVLLHQPLVRVLASGERHRRAPQEHEPVKRRRTGEENPLPDIGIASKSRPILGGVAVESETGGETERRSDEFQGIDGRELRN